MIKLEQIIFHVDVNNAFLSWEAVYRIRELGETIDLREGLYAVGGDREKRRGIILAKSPKAKKFGVKTGEPITESLRKCPELQFVPANHQLYARSSQAFINILRQYSPTVEQYSIDEAFVDMTGMEALFGSPLEAANRLRSHIFKELGFTVNIGVSSNKLLAKMASDFEKPDKVHTLFPGEIREKMWPLPVGKLFSVGASTAQQLNAMGIKTIGALAKTDPVLLKSHLKKHGEVIWNFANGRGMDLVEAEPADNKGYGNSVTIPFDVTDSDTARMVLLSLSDTVAARLRHHQVKAEVISVTVKDHLLQSRSHQMVLPTPTNISAELYQSACRLFEELWDGSPIRLLGVQTTRIREEGMRQMNIFESMDFEKQEKVDKAMDSIRQKFGTGAVKRAAFLENPPKEQETKKKSP